MITLEEILSEIGHYNPRAPLEMVSKAHDFSSRAHEGQKRKSGEPYLIHPLEVAKIITQLKMDTASVVAAILHDTIEDTPVTKKDIEKEFGTDVAEIVDGVTKISKLQFRTQEDRQAENYRKMILAMSKDIRVILVKLADRLNNMRTLQFMSEAKQTAISQETLDIYVPLASRMGIQWIKEELENLSLKYLKPEVYKQIEAIVKRLEKNRQDYIKQVADTLQTHLKPSIPRMEIQGRIKQNYSIYLKMVRQQIGIDEIHDLIAFRVLVPSIEHSYEALGVVHALWKPVQGRFKDYIAMSKANNYQSLHTTVVCFNGERVEFQIRTFEMHEIAEKGIAAHWRYKEDGALDTKDEAKFRWLRQLVDWQSELKDSIEFVDTVKLDLFADEIYVFTPKGEVRSLCRNATPVDFAFAIHSDLGLHCSGARVNGRLVPLSHKLESGDMVEIISSKGHQPSKDWLDFVVTSKARTHIRHFIRIEQRARSVAIGKTLFDNECQKHRISPAKALLSPEFGAFLRESKLGNAEEYFSALAYGKLQPETLLKILAPKAEAVREDNVIFKIFKKIGTRNKNIILVDQEDDVLVTFGKCCTPVNGDSIIGFVTRGRGVVVHCTECPRVLNTEPERRISVAWNDKVTAARTARIKMVTEDRKGVLAEITKVISERDVNITKVLVKVNPERLAVVSMDVHIFHRDDLIRVLKAIGNIRGVITAEREINA